MYFILDVVIMLQVLRAILISHGAVSVPLHVDALDDDDLHVQSTIFIITHVKMVIIQGISIISTMNVNRSLQSAHAQTLGLQRTCFEHVFGAF